MSTSNNDMAHSAIPSVNHPLAGTAAILRIVAWLLVCAAGFGQAPGSRETSPSAKGAEKSVAHDLYFPSATRSGEDLEAFWPFAVPDLAEQLGLSDKQLSQIKEKIYETRRKTIDLKAKADLARLDLELMLTSDTIHKKEAFALVDKVEEIEGEIVKLRISLTLAQNEILTQAQRRILSRMAIEHRRQSMAPPPAPPESKPPRHPSTVAPPKKGEIQDEQPLLDPNKIQEMIDENARKRRLEKETEKK